MSVSGQKLTYCLFHQKLQELHLKGADLTTLDLSGCTLLHHAVSAGSKEMVRYILDNGNCGNPSSIMNQNLSWNQAAGCRFNSAQGSTHPNMLNTFMSQQSVLHCNVSTQRSDLRICCVDESVHRYTNQHPAKYKQGFPSLKSASSCESTLPAPIAVALTSS